MSKDRYLLHKAAIAPLVHTGPPGIPDNTHQVIKKGLEAELIKYVLDQSLGPLWSHHLNQVTNPPIHTENLETLKLSRFTASAHYLLQKNSLKEIRQILDDSDIPHLIFKGAHLREAIYAEPALRPAADIDVLVTPEYRFKAVEQLTAAGFLPIIKRANISHEMSLAKPGLDIDLHWDILRPGRTRTPLAEEFVSQRQDYGSHWGPDETATLFIMLVHPVITKYCTTPHASIIRLLDIVLWIKQYSPDWDELSNLLHRSGLQTAAWIMLKWLNLLTDITAPPHFIEAIQPGTARRHYLQFWLEQNLSTRLLATPQLIQAGFTLPAHDRLADALHASRQASKAKRAARNEEEKFTERAHRYGQRETAEPRG